MDDGWRVLVEEVQAVGHVTEDVEVRRRIGDAVSLEVPRPRSAQ